MDKKMNRVRALLAGDPFRDLMMVEPRGRGVWGLCAGLCVLFALAALVLCAQMEGVVAIALVGTAGVAILLWGMSGELAKEKQPLVVWLFAALLAMLAVGAHLAMLDIKPGRYTNVLAPMFDNMWNYELLTAASWADDAWSGGYLLVCALFSRLERFSQLYAVKLFDMLCQCAAACAVIRLARLRGAKAGGSVGAGLACVLAPTMLMNAGCWAHGDAMFAALTLWGFALTLEERPWPGCVLLGAALATKLQSALIFPLLIVLFMQRKVSLRHLAAIAGAFVALQMAIVFDGQGFGALFTRYAEQLAIARDTIGLSDNAPGVYGLMNVASVREFSGMGLYLGIACALLVVAALLKSRRVLTNDVLITAALLLAAGLPLILPQMNARSLYLAGMLAFACAGDARRFAAAVLLEVVSLCSYMQAIFGMTIIPMNVLSLVAIGAAVLVALDLMGKLAAPEEERA